MNLCFCSSLTLTLLSFTIGILQFYFLNHFILPFAVAFTRFWNYFILFMPPLFIKIAESYRHKKYWLRFLTFLHIKMYDHITSHKNDWWIEALCSYISMHQKVNTAHSARKQENIIKNFIHCHYYSSGKPFLKCLKCYPGSIIDK